MSSTRHVADGERRKQNGWASAPEFDALRGLDGSAVAFKAALQLDPKARELLYCLLSLSQREGGLKRVARELVEMFPERLGSETMHKIGCKPGKRLSREQYSEIHGELHPHRWNDDWDDLLDREPRGKANEAAAEFRVPENAAAEFIAQCQRRAEQLDKFIEALCCDPKMEVSSNRKTEATYRGIVEGVIDDARSQLEENPALGRERPHLKTAAARDGSFSLADVPYFHDVLGALYEFKRRFSECARAEWVETTSGRIVFDALDYMLDTGRPVLLEGKSGYGKTWSMEAWNQINSGRAICFELEGITTQKDFFLKLGKATGVARGKGFSAGKIKQRVTEFLQRTKLAVVISEAQYLWPQGKRIESHPALINWLNTALFNAGVPYALIATEQFTKRRQHVEAQTDWSSEQLRRRTRRVFNLPAAPTKADLNAVARKLVGDLGAACAEYVADYAFGSKGYFQAIGDAVDDARLIAKRAGRDKITFKDLRAAIHDWRAPSDAALQRVFDSEPVKPRRGKQPRFAPAEVEPEAPEETPVPQHFRGTERGFNGGLTAPETARRSVRPEAAPVLAG